MARQIAGRKNKPRKWESELLTLAESALNLPPADHQRGLDLEHLARTSVKHLMRRSRRAICRKTGLKLWEREILASAHVALGLPLPTNPGTQVRPSRKGQSGTPWWRALFPKETYGNMWFASAGIVAARVHYKVRPGSAPRPPRLVLEGIGSPEEARELLEALTAHVAALPMGA